MKRDSVILIFLIFIPFLSFLPFLKVNEILFKILTSLIISIIAGIIAYRFIPVFMPMTEKGGLYGKDLCKKGTSTEDKHIPESLGVVTGCLEIISIILMQIIFGKDSQTIATFSSACLSICFVTLLGFTDDVVDLRWRYKLVLPALGCLPLVQGYIFQNGSTSIVLPKYFGFLFGQSETQQTILGKFLSLFFTIGGDIYGTYVDLGILYYLYILLLSIFCTNAINIYAGINGIEVGQSIIISASLLLMNIYEIVMGGDSLYVSNHLFSLMIILPFLCTSLALFAYNSYPAQCFVGDVYTYTAGVTFAVIGIFGHFSKSLLLFFIPQFINFIYSLPQLLSFLPFSIPCPRHRLPKYDAELKLLVPSVYKEDDIPHEPYKTIKDYKPPQYINHTLINLVLYIFGPCTERQLTNKLLILQTACSIVAFIIRIYIEKYDMIDL